MWLYENQLFEKEKADHYYGFVYVIENIETGKRYIGRKYFTKASSKQVKGKKRRCRKESDWQEYWGSSQRLLLDLQELGKEKFKRVILRLCKTRGECNYWEAKYQFSFNVLENDDFYNDNIMMKFTRKNIGL